MLINKESYEDMVEAIKSKVSFKHPMLAKYNICAINQADEIVILKKYIKKVYVLTGEGNYLWFSFDIETGANKFLKESSIFEETNGK